MKSLTSTIAVGLVALAALLAAPVHAGFSISVKTIPAPKAAPALPSGAVVTMPVDAAHVVPVVESVKLSVARGANLKGEVTTFLSQFGWTPAWMAGDLIAGDAMVFEGKTHEDALTQFLSHYQLVGERFAEEKGYVIRRASDDKVGAK